MTNNFRCLLQGCGSTASFGAGLCPHCFVTLATGVVGPDDRNWIADMHTELMVALTLVESLSAIAIAVIDNDIKADPPPERCYNTDL
jgi:hypothetical protein